MSGRGETALSPSRSSPATREVDGRGLSTIYDHTIRRPDGTDVSLADHRGRVLLIVNTASFCQYTPQYAELVALHREMARDGLSVLAFPCDQFGGQEPGNADEIAIFCRVAYDVTFPVFAKIEVNGPNAHPLYRFLKGAKPGIFGTPWIKWNFTKFLVDRDGRVRARFAPRRRPATLTRHIRTLL